MRELYTTWQWRWCVADSSGWVMATVVLACLSDWGEARGEAGGLGIFVGKFVAKVHTLGIHEVSRHVFDGVDAPLGLDLVIG